MSSPTSLPSNEISKFSGILLARQLNSKSLLTTFKTPPCFKPGESSWLENSTGIAAVVSKLYGGDYQIAIIVGLSMVTIVFVANAFGALLPFILSRLKIDPAAASSPLITSIMDVLGLMIYFSIATVILS